VEPLPRNALAHKRLRYLLDSVNPSNCCVL
jgi:hypothetical protein